MSSKRVEVWSKARPFKPTREKRKESYNYRKPIIASYEFDKTDPPMSKLLAWEYARIWERENAISFQEWNRTKKSNEELYRNRVNALKAFLKKQSEENRLKKIKNRLMEESKNTKTDVNASKETKKTDVNASKETKKNFCTCSVPKPSMILRCNNCGAIVNTDLSDPKNLGFNWKENECFCEKCHRPIPNLAKQ